MNNVPNRSYSVGNMYTYDYRIHKWIYWCIDLNGKNIVREARKQELEMVKLHQKIIDKHERENAAWLNHKQCRKRNCICKKCEKYCHCYDCVEKIGECDDFTQEEC